LIATDLAGALDPVSFATRCGITCDAWQAEVLRARPRRALLNCSRQSGKTTTTALLALHTAVYTPGALVVVVSPSQRQSAEFLRTLKLLHAKIDGAPTLVTDSVLRIELENASRVIALPSTEATVRGLASVALLVVDEAARVPDDLIAACKPMLAVSNGALVMLSTPAGRRGKFFELFHSDDPEWIRVRVPASECPRISAEFLAAEHKELGEARFQEEYELAFIDSDTAAFPTAIIDALFSDESVRPLWI